ncbi:MAG: TatD family hydrolase, partial [bacterium]|nr:TatD family hydrolase [bacterium]
LADIRKSEGCSFGVVHCFSDTVLEARILLDMGFYIGFTGSVTFKNADDIREAASYVPLDRILFETDSPYLAPVPYRGKRNDPSLIPVIAERLADIKGISKETLADAVWHNARKLFSID